MYTVSALWLFDTVDYVTGKPYDLAQSGETLEERLVKQDLDVCGQNGCTFGQRLCLGAGQVQDRCSVRGQD